MLKRVDLGKRKIEKQSGREEFGLTEPFIIYSILEWGSRNALMDRIVCPCLLLM